MTHTRDLRKNPGIKRPYLNLPDTLEGKQSYCITIPGGLSNKLVLIDILSMATQWFNWQRTSGIEGKQTADAWRNTLNLPELNMCCCPQPTNRRYNSSGELEVSYDGGETWVTDTTLDDRFSGIIAPAITVEEGQEIKCVGVTAGEEYVKQNLIESLDTGATFADINAVGVALIALLGVTGIGLLIAGLASAIFVAGVSAVQAAFTTEVWTAYRCILYCHAEADASFTEAGWNAVKADILAQFTGIVSAVLYNWVNTVGPVGLTNSLRSGFAASGDCSSCDCSCQFSVTFQSGGWDAYTVAFGTVASNRLDLVAHTYPLGDGTGCEIEIDMIETCLVSTLPFDIQATNTRPGNSVSISWEFLNSSHVSVGSGGGDFSGVADGTPQHLTPTITPTNAQYVVLRVGWLNDPGTNEGFIDNIQINH